MTIRLSIEAENVEELLDQLLSEIPKIHEAINQNYLSGGKEMPWKIQDITKEKEVLAQCKKQKSCRDCPKFDICHKVKLW